MIQRVQTLWLLAASVCAFLTLKFSFFSGNKMANNVKQFVPLNGLENIVLTILTVAVAVAALVLIFLYKDRKKQLWLALATALVSVINVALYFSETKKYLPGEGNYDLTAVLAFVIPVFLLLAVRGIYRDEKLVKSVNRLR